MITAKFSDCGRFRHTLSWRWADGLVLPWILFNPSIAGSVNDSGEVQADPTLRKGRGFSERAGFGGLIFVNAYDFISTDPKGLKAAGYPVSDDCDEHILAACSMGDGRIVCAWGALGRGLARPAAVLALVRSKGYRPLALGFTADGLPRHPLMLGYSTKLEPF